MTTADRAKLIFELTDKQLKDKEKPFQIDKEGKKPEDLVKVYISSHGIENKQIFRNGKKCKYIYGNLNGETFEIQCDALVAIPLYLAEFLEKYIQK